jgi:hypothetical protein
MNIFVIGRLQYHDMNMFVIGIVDDLKKVVIWLNIRDCNFVISNRACTLPINFLKFETKFLSWIKLPCYVLFDYYLVI